MPDPILMVESLAAAFVAAALVVAAGRFLDRRRAGVVQALAIALGAYLGLAVLGVRPKWPPREDQDRLLALILPGVLALEALLATAPTYVWTAAVARFAASIAVAPVLLHGSSYVADLAGPGTAEWGPIGRFAIPAGLGLALFAAWAALDWASRRSDSAVRAPVALAISIGAAGAAVMLSGYASGGMNGLPMAGAVGGAALVAGLWSGDRRDALAGIGTVALFSLLLAGYCFGELKPDAAALLFLAPTLAAVPELPPLHRLRPWVRTACAFVLVGLTAAGAVGLTVKRFQARAAEGPASGPGVPSADDYGQFR